MQCFSKEGLLPDVTQKNLQLYCFFLKELHNVSFIDNYVISLLNVSEEKISAVKLIQKANCFLWLI